MNRGRSGGVGRAGVLATALGTLLADALAGGVVGVRVDALAVGGLADVEGDSLDV
jgi:hypothetical protein